MLAVPPVVRSKALSVGAGAWLERLPALLDELAGEWGLTVGEAYADPTEAYVVRADLADGSPAVLKLAVSADDDAARREVTVLRLADGRGCARLLRADPDRGALLLERLGPPLSALHLPLAARHEVLCDTAAALWRPAPDADLPTGADKGRWLADYIPRAWAALDRPCSERAVEHALACAARRVAAHDDGRARLVHGDVHQWNTLRAGDGFKLVDPDGLLAEPEYDMGIVMREDPEDLLHSGSRDRARRLGRRTGLDARAIWQWGVVERVSTGMLGTEVDLQPSARLMLAVADRLAASVDDLRTGGWAG